MSGASGRSARRASTAAMMPTVAKPVIPIVAGSAVEGIPAELTSPPLGSPPAQVESEGDARNSPMV